MRTKDNQGYYLNPVNLTLGENRVLNLQEKLENIKLITEEIKLHSTRSWVDGDSQCNYLEDHLDYLKLQIESIDIRRDL